MSLPKIVRASRQKTKSFLLPCPFIKANTNCGPDSGSFLPPQMTWPKDSSWPCPAAWIPDVVKSSTKSGHHSWFLTKNRKKKKKAKQWDKEVVLASPRQEDPWCMWARHLVYLASTRPVRDTEKGGLLLRKDTWGVSWFSHVRISKCRHRYIF